MSTFVLIGVPPHLVPAVTALITNDSAEAVSPAGATDEGALVNGWTEETLRQHFRDSSEKMQRFLVWLAQHADEEVTSHDAAEAIDSPGWNSIAGMLGAAQRRAKNHFGHDDAPWRRRWGRDDQAKLTMPPDVAGIVLDEASE